MLEDDRADQSMKLRPLKILGYLLPVGITLLLGGIACNWVNHAVLFFTLPTPPDAYDVKLAYGPDVPGFSKGYIVDQSPGEVLAFYQTHLPSRGWRLQVSELADARLPIICIQLRRPLINPIYIAVVQQIRPLHEEGVERAVVSLETWGYPSLCQQNFSQ